ncbi:MAG: MutS family DNA mismatch repair protein [Nitrospira sp.]|nr:MutS family DNA mismatch repair protein [Nitrospira sp.]MDE0486038.1 MutS family DNA mismatch repair protein [Nitrospira sp.]
MDNVRRKRERMIVRGRDRGTRLLLKGRRVSLALSRSRMGLVLVGLLICVSSYKLGWFVAGNWALLGFFLCFLGVANVHNRLERRLRRLGTWVDVQESNLARLRVDWESIPETTLRLSSEHPYAADLDLLGKYSLFRLLDTTVSRDGQLLLIAWMTRQDALSFERWESRQQLVRVLTSLRGLRDRVRLVANCLSPNSITTDRLESLLENSGPMARLGLLLLTASALAGLNMVLFVFWLLGGSGYWIVSFLLYALLLLLTGRRVSHVFGRALNLHLELDKLAAVIGIFEKRSYGRYPELQAMTDLWRNEDGRPSVAIRQLARVCSGLSLKAHPLLHIAIHLVVPWDLAWTWYLQKVCNRLRPVLPDWILHLAIIDAAMALATFAYLNPSYAWPCRRPEGNATPIGISGTAIGHPLLAHEQRINNDLTLEGLGRVFLVTGSNMSGKSTFLRTVGINACLAQAGGPVCAESWSWSWLRIRTCIRVEDRLEEGLSYFYAEVKRLKSLLVAMADGDKAPVLFLIDEIFKGTNNRERLLGSEAFIRELTVGRGLGLVTTHDLELANLERELANFVNVHFQETVGDKALQFDYCLRPGPCPTTNALHIMAMEGLPVPKTPSDNSGNEGTSDLL